MSPSVTKRKKSTWLRTSRDKLCKIYVFTLSVYIAPILHWSTRVGGCQQVDVVPHGCLSSLPPAASAWPEVGARCEVRRPGRHERLRDWETETVTRLRPSHHQAGHGSPHSHPRYLPHGQSSQSQPVPASPREIKHQIFQISHAYNIDHNSIDIEPRGYHDAEDPR